MRAACEWDVWATIPLTNELKASPPDNTETFQHTSHFNVGETLRQGSADIFIIASLLEYCPFTTVKEQHSDTLGWDQEVQRCSCWGIGFSCILRPLHHTLKHLPRRPSDLVWLSAMSWSWLRIHLPVLCLNSHSGTWQKWRQSPYVTRADFHAC